ncbi:hypothetical protein B0H14DRAFT_3899204 [Mycena olivaceomarginata]|nr:hypothetical protein B0H14DRAFT_3899204 [Mycena olivaceomarginata]
MTSKQSILLWRTLGTNCEREVENKGMQDAIFDFDKQTGIEPDKHDNILSLILGCEDDLLTYFDNLAATNKLPTLEELLAQAAMRRERYASQAAYDQSLDKAEHEEAAPRTKFPAGSSWTSPCAPEIPAPAQPTHIRISSW